MWFRNSFLQHEILITLYMCGGHSGPSSEYIINNFLYSDRHSEPFGPLQVPATLHPIVYRNNISVSLRFIVYEPSRRNISLLSLSRPLIIGTRKRL